MSSRLRLQDMSSRRLQDQQIFTGKTPKQCQWLCFGVFIVNLELTLNLLLRFTVDFEQLAACWNWAINV